jgi:hypothetical protein
MPFSIFLVPLLFLQGGGSQVYFAPTAMQVNLTQLPNLPYKNPVNGVVQVRQHGSARCRVCHVSSAFQVLIHVVPVSSPLLSSLST